MSGAALKVDRAVPGAMIRNANRDDDIAIRLMSRRRLSEL